MKIILVCLDRTWNNAAFAILITNVREIDGSPSVTTTSNSCDGRLYQNSDTVRVPVHRRKSLSKRLHSTRSMQNWLERLHITLQEAELHLNDYVRFKALFGYTRTETPSTMEILRL